MKSDNKEVSSLKITFILQTFNKVQYLQSIHDNLISQISKFDSNITPYFRKTSLLNASVHFHART